MCGILRNFKIKDSKFREAIDILNYQMQNNSKVSAVCVVVVISCDSLANLNLTLVYLCTVKSRAGLSLLGYCYFYIQDYVNASDCYEQLTILYPEQEQYKLYYSQALYKCGLFQESIKAASQIETPEIRAKVIELKLNQIKA